MGWQQFNTAALYDRYFGIGCDPALSSKTQQDPEPLEGGVLGVLFDIQALRLLRGLSPKLPQIIGRHGMRALQKLRRFAGEQDIPEGVRQISKSDA